MHRLGQKVQSTGQSQSAPSLATTCIMNMHNATCVRTEDTNFKGSDLSAPLFTSNQVLSNIWSAAAEENVLIQELYTKFSVNS